MIKFLKYFVPLAVIVFGIGFYVINKPPKSFKATKPAFEMSAADLFSQFSDDESSANEKYLDQVVKISGKVLDVKLNDDGKSIAKVQIESGDDMFGISCEFDPADPIAPGAISAGSNVSIKGLCTGVLMDVVLVRCVLEK